MTLEERKAQLVRRIEVIGRLNQNRDWLILKEEVFDPRVNYLEKLLFLSAKVSPLKLEEIYQLQGKLEEANRYQLDKLLEMFKVELKNIKL